MSEQGKVAEVSGLPGLQGLDPAMDFEFYSVCSAAIRCLRILAGASVIVVGVSEVPACLSSAGFSVACPPDLGALRRVAAGAHDFALVTGRISGASDSELVAEARRVARRGVIALVASRDREVEAAVKAVSALERALCVAGGPGGDRPGLLEGIDDGVAGLSASAVSIPTGYLYGWLSMRMALAHVRSIDRSGELEHAVDELYNSNFSGYDNASPSRWTLIVSGCNDDEAARLKEHVLSPALDDAAAALRLQVARLLMQWVDTFVLSARDAYVRTLEERVRYLDGELSRLNANPAVAVLRRAGIVPRSE